MKSWSSTKFLQSKVQELLEASMKLHNDYATAEEISKYVSLANGVKKCFLQAGILDCYDTLSCEIDQFYTILENK